MASTKKPWWREDDDDEPTEASPDDEEILGLHRRVRAVEGRSDMALKLHGDRLTRVEHRTEDLSKGYHELRDDLREFARESLARAESAEKAAGEFRATVGEEFGKIHNHFERQKLWFIDHEDRLEDQQKAIDKNTATLESHTTAIDKNTSTIAALKADVNTRFDAAEGRFDGLEGRFDGLEGRFDGLEGRFDGLEGRFDGLEGRFDGLEGRFDGLEGRFDGLEGRFDGLEGRFDTLEELIRGGKGGGA